MRNAPRTSGMRVLSPLFVACALLATGCAGPSARTPANAASYRVIWDARRPAEKTALAAVASPPVRVGAGEIRVRTDSQRAEETGRRSRSSGRVCRRRPNAASSNW